jgi:hypothetical protein
MTTPEIKEAVEFEDIFLQDKIERRAYEQREKAIRDYYSYMSVFRRDYNKVYISKLYKLQKIC